MQSQLYHDAPFTPAAYLTTMETSSLTSGVAFRSSLRRASWMLLLVVVVVAVLVLVLAVLTLLVVLLMIEVLTLLVGLHVHAVDEVAPKHAEHCCLRSYEFDESSESKHMCVRKKIESTFVSAIFCRFGAVPVLLG